MADDKSNAPKLGPAKRSIPTADVLTAAMSRLNRQSVLALLGQLASAMNTCCDERVSDDHIRALAHSEVTNYSYSESLGSLVNLINTEIDAYDFNGSKNTTLGSYIRNTLRAYDYSASNNIKIAIDARIASYNYGGVVDARISNYNHSTIIDSHLATYDFRLANNNFTIALNNYLTSYDFLNITNGTFNTVVDNRVGNYDFRKTNNTFNVAVEAQIASYDFSAIITRLLTSYDFHGLSSASFDSTIDERIKSYDFSRHVVLNQYFESTLNKFDFTACLSLTNVLRSSIVNFDFSSHAALSQLFVRKLEEFDFSNHTSINNHFETKSTEVKGWIDAAVEGIHRTTASLGGEITNVAGAITTLRSDINIHSATIDDLKMSIASIQDLKAIKVQLDVLQQELARAVALAGELDEREVGQVRELIVAILADEVNARTIFKNIRIDIDEKALSLMEILNVIVAADQVEGVTIDYPISDDDPKLITGCTYALTDGTAIKFNCTSSPKPDGSVSLEFRTLDWKGLPASFTSTFARRSTKRRVCKRDVTLDWYEPIKSTNVVFSLFH